MLLPARVHQIRAPAALPPSPHPSFINLSLVPPPPFPSPILHQSLPSPFPPFPSPILHQSLPSPFPPFPSPILHQSLILTNPSSSPCPVPRCCPPSQILFINPSLPPLLPIFIITLAQLAIHPFHMGIWRLLLIVLFLVPSKTLQLTIDDEEFGLNLQLIKHQPCPFKSDKSKWDRKLEFEAGTEREGPKLMQRPNEPNCYSIGGKVTVFAEFKGEFSIYLELRSSANKKQVPEPCHNRKEDGCGGFGSCLYCDACQTLEESKGLKAQLLVDGKSISCGQEMSPGTYENMELVFCLPNADEMLKSQGLTKDTFKSLIQSEDGTNLRSFGIFATIYVFDKDVRKLVQTQQKVEAVYRKTKRTLFKDEPLPPDVYWSLPFNSVIKEQRSFVACHKIYGNMQIRNNK